MANDISGYYSDMTQETKYGTYDCGGYTIKIEVISPNELKVYFVSHEGNCGIDGSLAEEIKYFQENNSIYFTVPFMSSVGGSFYKFRGKIDNNMISGDLHIEYPEPKYNKVDHIELFKKSDDFKKQYK